MLRGREQSRPIGGVEMLQRLAADVEEYGTIESAPKQEGRNVVMTLAPKGKGAHAVRQRRRGAESAPSARPVRPHAWPPSREAGPRPPPRPRPR